jgi:surface antigen
LTFDPWDNASCRVSFRGPHRLRSGPYSKVMKGGLVRVSWTVSRRAANGRWTLAVSCRGSGKSAGTVRRSLRVRGGARTAGANALVSGRSLRWGVRAVPGQPKPSAGPTDVADGRGAADNPFEERWCTWLAYDRRPDIYQTAIAKGLPRSGWNGYQWADKARRAGFTVDTRPAVGAIAVFSREYYGGPNNDERGGQYGHVAYVTAVHANGSFSVLERNGSLPPATKSGNRDMRSGIEFIYGGPAAAGPGDQGVPNSGGANGTGTRPPRRSDFNGDGRDDIAVLYGYPGDNTAVWTFAGGANALTGGPSQRWISGPGNWSWTASTLPADPG